jgi:hypothetical protein
MWLGLAPGSKVGCWGRSGQRWTTWSSHAPVGCGRERHGLGAPATALECCRRVEKHRGNGGGAANAESQVKPQLGDKCDSTGEREKTDRGKTESPKEGICE